MTPAMYSDLVWTLPPACVYVRSSASRSFSAARSCLTAALSQPSATWRTASAGSAAAIIRNIAIAWTHIETVHPFDKWTLLKNGEGNEPGYGQIERFVQ